MLTNSNLKQKQKIKIVISEIGSFLNSRPSVAGSIKSAYMILVALKTPAVRNIM